jgi:phosphoribosylformylglycinamidine synthase I
VKAIVITFPGSNCDYDGYQAFKQVGADVSFRWHREKNLGDPDVVLLPGGFSYGDYLRPGAIARMSPIMDAVIDFARRGGPVLGICNGFQVLCEAGLLPGALLRNTSRLFKSTDVWLHVERPDTLFTSEYQVGQVLRIPIAHADGNYYADPETLERLEGEGQVVFRYCSPTGQPDDAYNPNGSLHRIAGIVNGAGNVLGMMPHPERATEPALGSTDGLGVFESLLSSVVAT